MRELSSRSVAAANIEGAARSTIIVGNAEHVSVALDAAKEGTVRVSQDSPSYQPSMSRIERAATPGTAEQFPSNSGPPQHVIASLPGNFHTIVSLSDEVKLVLVRVPGGSFRMGACDSAGSPAEHPQHLITLSSFYIGETSVTQRQYESVVGVNPSISRNPDFPVENISWLDSIIFANELSRRVGLQPAYTISDSRDVDCQVQWDRGSDGCRLPTEAEWEYACRAMTTTRYWCGDHPAELTRVAWYYKNSCGSPHRVGDLKPNPWGLFDMHGNVNEWAWDWFDPHWYSVSPTHDPSGPIDGNTRVVRGGAWSDSHTRLRASYRAGFEPAATSRDIGLRVVRTCKLPHS
jgi:formylglycine-generating enzyme required for sulfatase activity